LSDEALLGRYRLLAELGHGGMADVFLACMNGVGGFQKLSVIKLAKHTDDPAFIQMFLDEARLAARLSHPNVVQTYEVGDDSGRQFMVMEYLDGPSLYLLGRRAAQAGKTLDLRLVVQILSNVLDGLHYAHTLTDLAGEPLKVVHRDLTPHNLIVTVQGVCKILDFGIAKAADSRTMTEAGFYRGKLNYMAPEQALGEAVDCRADIFSMGIMLAEAILRKPFWGDASGPVISTRLLSGDIPDIRQAKIDPVLEEICAAALAPKRDDRVASAAELKQQMDWYLKQTGGSITQKELADFVGPLFAEDRARIRAAVETALRNPTQKSGFETARLERVSQNTPSRPNAHAIVTPRTPMAGSRVPTLAAPDSDEVMLDGPEILEEADIPTTVAPNLLAQQQRRSSTPWKLVAGVGGASVAILGIAIGILVGTRSQPQPLPAPQPIVPTAEAHPVPPPLPVAAPVQPVAPAQPATVVAAPPTTAPGPAATPTPTAPEQPKPPDPVAEAPKPKPPPPPAPPPRPVVVAPPRGVHVRPGHAATPTPVAAPVAENAVQPPPPAATPATPVQTERDIEEVRPAPVRRGDHRALDTDVFDSKKQEIDRDVWQKDKQ
jgi:serine/threonine-protein kinase